MVIVDLSEITLIDKHTHTCVRIYCKQQIVHKNGIVRKASIKGGQKKHCLTAGIQQRRNIRDDVYPYSMRMVSMLQPSHVPSKFCFLGLNLKWGGLNGGRATFCASASSSPCIIGPSMLKIPLRIWRAF